MGLKITVSGEDLDAYAEVFAKKYSYQDEVYDGKDLIPNPQTKTEFFAERVLEFIGGVYAGGVVDEFDLGKSAAIEQAKEFNKGLSGEIL